MRVHDARVDLLQNELEIDSDAWSVSTWFEAPVEDIEENRYALFHSPGASYIMHSSENTPSMELGIFSGSDEFRTSFNVNSLNEGWHHLVTISEVGQTSFC